MIVKGKTTAVFQKAVVELTPICKMIIKVVQQALGQQENRLMGQKNFKTRLTSCMGGPLKYNPVCQCLCKRFYLIFNTKKSKF